MTQDLRQALRALRSKRASAAIVILCLGLGVGMNGAVFSLVYSVLFRPLPFASPEGLVLLRNFSRQDPGTQMGLSPADLMDLRAQTTSLSDVAGYTLSEITVGTEGGSVRALAGVTTEGFFDTLGVNPTHGRLLAAEEYGLGATATAVVAEAFARRQFGSPDAAVGQSLKISGKPFQIVGTLSDRVRLRGPVELWLAMPSDPARASRTSHILVAVGRLAERESVARAQAEMETLADRLAAAYPPTNQHLRTLVLPLRENMNRNARPVLLGLWGAAGCVLLLVAANCIFLLSAWLRQRRPELSLRQALGASGSRLALQLALETTLLAMVGALVALWVGHITLEVAQALQPAGIPGLKEASFDWTSAAYVVTLALTTGGAIGLAAYGLHRMAGRTRTSSAGLSGLMRRLQPMQTGLLVAEVAMAFVLAAGAGLMVRTVDALSDVDPGFESRGVWAMTIVPPAQKFPPGSPQLAALLESSVQTLGALAGVESSASAVMGPLSGSMMERRVIVPLETGGEVSAPGGIAGQAVSSGYFETLGVRVVQGRTFGPKEVEGVAIVNEPFVETVLGPGDVLGRRLLVETRLKPQPVLVEIIGVVAAEKQIALDHEVLPMVYLPHQTDLMPFATLFFRAPPASSAMAQSARAAIRRLNPELAVDEAIPLESLVLESMAPQRHMRSLLGALALLALMLAGVGVYGISSLFATSRKHEFGIRMSLGEPPLKICWRVLLRCLATSLGGLALGVAIALSATRLISGLLFEVSPFDPKAFVTAGLLVLVAATLAGVLPAMRASRIDPTLSLRSE